MAGYIINAELVTGNEDIYYEADSTISIIQTTGQSGQEETVYWQRYGVKDMTLWEYYTAQEVVTGQEVNPSLSAHGVNIGRYKHTNYKGLDIDPQMTNYTIQLDMYITSTKFRIGLIENKQNNGTNDERDKAYFKSDEIRTTIIGNHTATLTFDENGLVHFFFDDIYCGSETLAPVHDNNYNLYFYSTNGEVHVRTIKSFPSYLEKNMDTSWLRYGMDRVPFSLSDGSPFYWTNTATVNPAVNTDGTLEMGTGKQAHFYLPHPDSDCDWKMICQLDKNITDQYFRVGYLCEDWSLQRTLQIYTSEVRFYEGSSFTRHTIIRATEQYLVIEKQGNTIVLHYPTSNGTETITSTYTGTTNQRIQLYNAGSGNVTIKQFTYLDSTGGGDNMKVIPIWDYATNRDTATSEGTLANPSQLPELQEDTNYLSLGMRYDVVFDELLDFQNYDYYIDLKFAHSVTRIGLYNSTTQVRSWIRLANIDEEGDSDINTLRLYVDGGNCCVDWHDKTAILTQNININHSLHLTAYAISILENKIYMIRKVDKNDGGGNNMNVRTYLPVSSLDNWIIDRQTAINGTVNEQEEGVEPKLNENGLMIGYRYDCVYEKVLDMTGGHEYYITIKYRHRYTRIGLRRTKNNAIVQEYRAVLHFNETIPSSPTLATFRLFVENGKIYLQHNNNTILFINGNTATDYRLYLYGLYSEGNEECISILEKEA